MDHHPAATAARNMVRGALKGSLATLDAVTGTPYASMILLATTPDGQPYTVMSGLARHTRNVSNCDAASILIDTSNAAGDATSGGRITLLGRLLVDPSAQYKRRFLARHQAAVDYVDFSDFAFYTLEIASAHLIEGFGRIVTLPRDSIVLPTEIALAIGECEGAALTRLKSQWPTVVGLDCEGIDIIQSGCPTRLDFTARVIDPYELDRIAANCLAKYYGHE